MIFPLCRLITHFDNARDLRVFSTSASGLTTRCTRSLAAKTDTSMWAHALTLIHVLSIAHSRPLGGSSPQVPRELAGLFDGDILFPSTSGANGVETHFSYEAASRTLGETFVTSTSEAKKSKAITSISHAAHSILGAPPNRTADAQSAATLGLTSTSTSAAAPTFTIGVASEAPRMPPGEATEWKVIGLAVICISFVATVILSIVFFDSWWSFLRDLIPGKRKIQGVEDLLPDQEKRNWEFKLASEDGHRYPTLASLESITKEQAERDHDGSGVKSNVSRPRQFAELASSMPPYLSDYDPHPLEPLFRRPSTRLAPSLQATA